MPGFDRLWDGRIVQAGLQLKQATGEGCITSNRGMGVERGLAGSALSYNDIRPSVLLDLPKANMDLQPSVDENDKLVK
jgi:hypothetical protein